MKYCIECGEKVKDFVKICPDCGEDIDKPSKASALQPSLIANSKAVSQSYSFEDFEIEADITVDANVESFKL